MSLRRGELGGGSLKQREDKKEFLQQGDFIKRLTDVHLAFSYLVFFFLPQLNNGNTLESDLIVKGKINL